MIRTMTWRIVAICFIYVCTSVAWLLLGGITYQRTYTLNNRLKSAVGELYGTVHRQVAPSVFYQTKRLRTEKVTEEGRTVTRTVEEVETHPLLLQGSDITVDLKADYRKKGLLWYSTYKVAFEGTYLVENTTTGEREICFSFQFPAENGVYDDFACLIDGTEAKDVRIEGTGFSRMLKMKPGQRTAVTVRYRSQGMDQWWYSFGEGVSEVRDFTLRMTTNFRRVDFPEESVSPTQKEETQGGCVLTWQYKRLVSGIRIGVELPDRLNPGPFVSRVTFFAPVSLFLFLFLMLIITTLRKVRIHPMNYFFVCAAFFSFHLLLAYLADHIDIHAAMAISSAVSIFLVVTYMRLVTGARFALVEVGLSQFLYLVVFAYTFFLKGFTGLAITILCILTLFVVMQLTGKVDWSRGFREAG